MIDYHKEAVTDFDSVLKRNPKNAHAHFRRAFSLKALKKFPQAVESFREA
jgi:Tfp pilus assembly protein PilF